MRSANASPPASPERRAARRRLTLLLAGCLHAMAATAAADSRWFTDADLERVLARERDGVIYLWSPHMPYSVKGATEARRAGEALGFATVVLLDPNAEPALAEHVQRAHGLPPAALVRLRSTTLQQRGLTQHFPTALVFRAGALDTQIMPGYAPGEDLAQYVLRRLGR